MTTVFICVSCRAGEAGDARPGLQMLAAVSAAIAEQSVSGITVEPVECLSVCKRPCTVALAGAGKWTYVVGDLDPVAQVADVVTAARHYAATTDGIVPWRERPQSFRKGVVSRVPPLK